MEVRANWENNSGIVNALIFDGNVSRDKWVSASNSRLPKKSSTEVIKLYMYTCMYIYIYITGQSRKKTF